MTFKLHDSCLDCLAFRRNRKEGSYCRLKVKTDIIKPLEKCYKPTSNIHYAILYLLRRNA